MWEYVALCIINKFRIQIISKISKCKTDETVESDWENKTEIVYNKCLNPLSFYPFIQPATQPARSYHQKLRKQCGAMFVSTSVCTYVSPTYSNPYSFSFSYTSKCVKFRIKKSFVNLKWKFCADEAAIRSPSPLAFIRWYGWWKC